MNTLRHRKKHEEHLMKKQVILFLSILCHLHSSHAEPVINPANSGKYFYVSGNVDNFQKSSTLSERTKPQERVPSWDELLPKKPIQQQASPIVPMTISSQNTISTQLQQNSIPLQQIEQLQQPNVTTHPTIIDRASDQDRSNKPPVIYQAQPHQQNVENTEPQQQNAIFPQDFQQDTGSVVTHIIQQDSAMSVTQITEQQIQQKNVIPVTPSQQPSTTPTTQSDQQPKTGSDTFSAQ